MITFISRCFSKNVKLFTNINIMYNNVYEQYSLLKSVNITPLSLRLFNRCCSFTHSIMKSSKTVLWKRHLKHQGSSLRLRSTVIQASFNTGYWKNSFCYLATKLLNLFIERNLHLSKDDFSKLLTNKGFDYFDKLKDYFII